jgi:hypothetical protein
MHGSMQTRRHAVVIETEKLTVPHDIAVTDPERCRRGLALEATLALPLGMGEALAPERHEAVAERVKAIDHFP